MQKKSNGKTWLWIVGGLLVFGAIGSAIGPTKELPKTQSEIAEAKKQAAADKKEADAQAAEDKKQAKAAKELAAVEKIRGPKPEVVVGESCSAVDAWFDENLKDRQSLEVIGAGEALPYLKDAWSQTVKYRAKNSFGGYDVEKRLFVIRDGKVIDSADISG